MAIRVPVLEKFSWQENVKSIVTTLPATPEKGDRYIIATTAATHAGEIAWYDGSAWQYDTPKKGWHTYIESLDADYRYTVEIDNTDPLNPVETPDWTPNVPPSDGTGIQENTDTSAFDVNWKIEDNDQTALRIYTDGPDNNGTPTELDLITIDTRDDQEKITLGAETVINGNLTVQGDVTTVNTRELQVEDSLVELNIGGNQQTIASQGGAGLVIKGVESEEDENNPNTYIDVVKEYGYIKSTTIDNVDAGYHFKAPNSEHTYSILLDYTGTAGTPYDSSTDPDTDATAATRVSDPLATITKNVVVLFRDNIVNSAFHTADINEFIFDQSLASTDNVKFKNLLLTGNEKVVGTLDVIGDVKIGIDSENVPANLKLTGQLQDGTGNNAVTVEQLKETYDSRAYYDEDLECVVFADTITTVKSEKKPHVVSSTPTNNASGVSVSDPIVLTFNKNVAVNDSTGIKLYDSSNTEVTVVPTATNNTLTIAPSADLEEGETYKVVLEAGSVVFEGTTTANDEDDPAVSFTTIKTVTLTLQSADPVNGANGVDPNSTITLTFNEDVVLTKGPNGYIIFTEV